MAYRLFQVDDENRHAFGFFLDLSHRRCAREQDHQVGMLDARDPHLLAIHHITVTLPDCRGFELGGVRACRRFCHRHGLQAQLAAGDARQILGFLRVRPMAQQGTHVVHLAMAGTRVATAAIDFFHDDRCFSQTQPGTTVFLRDHHRQPASFGQCVNKFFRVAAFFINTAKILIGIMRA